MKYGKVCILIAATLVFNGGIFAQEFPSKPIELVTHTASGGSDATARAMLIGFRKELNNDAFVQIKAGGGGTIAMSYVKSRPADGHTLLFITPTHLITIARGRAPIGINDIKGLVRGGDDPIIIVAQKSTGFKTIDDLIKASKKSSIKWGGTQVGGIDHIAAMSFAKNSGAKISYVPFKGGSITITNLMGNNIQAAGLNYGEAVDGISSGDFVPLAVMAPHRLKVLPAVATLDELGIKGVHFSTVRGVVVLKDVPERRAKILENALLTSMKQPEYRSFLTGLGLDSSSVAGSDVWDAQIRSMFANIQQTLIELGIKK